MSQTMNATRVFRTLNAPMTILGVERRIFFAILTVSLAIFYIGESLPPAVVLFAVLRFAGKMVTQNEPQFLQIAMNSSRYAVRYDPAILERLDS